jgi:hypothetical protein
MLTAGGTTCSALDEGEQVSVDDFGVHGAEAVCKFDALAGGCERLDDAVREAAAVRPELYDVGGHRVGETGMMTPAPLSARDHGALSL